MDAWQWQIRWGLYYFTYKKQLARKKKRKGVSAYSCKNQRREREKENRGRGTRGNVQAPRGRRKSI